jgi:hypothetical protein
MRVVATLCFSIAVLTATPAFAQPPTFDAERAATMATCTEVINLQYESEEEPPPRWMDCVNAVAAFVDTVGAPSPDADPAIDLLVEELVQLYRFDAGCKIAETELPLAIRTAAEATFDEEIRALYLELFQQILDCEFEGLAVIPASPA